VNNDPGECGANVTVPDPVVDADCVGTLNSFDITGPSTPFNWPAGGNGTVLDTDVDLPGAITAAGNVTLSITWQGDFDFANLEELDLRGPDGSQVFFGNTSGQCVETTSTTSIDVATWNNWVSTFGSTLTFTSLANTGVNDNICTGEFIQLAASIPQPGTNLFNNDYNFMGNASDFLSSRYYRSNILHFRRWWTDC
jgi:hypothetical protein